MSNLDTETMDTEMLAMYFPSASSKETSPAIPVLHCNEDDRESGNGTYLPHSPSYLEGQKSLDSDYEDGKLQKGIYLDIVAMYLRGTPTGTQNQANRSWWYWRRSQNVNSTASVANNASKTGKLDDKENYRNAVATQTTCPNSPDISDHTLSKTDSAINAENTADIMDNMEDLSQEE